MVGRAKDVTTYILRNEDIRDRAARIVATLDILDESPWRIRIDRYRKTRSQEQNARYWALVTKIANGMAERPGYGYFTKEIWGEALAERFLGVEPGPFGNPVRKSTSDLSVPEFSDYMTEVEAWAAEEGIYLE